MSHLACSKCGDDPIKKCPFCGTDGELGYAGKLCWVKCVSCSAASEGAYSLEMALFNWNRRHDS